MSETQTQTQTQTQKTFRTSDLDFGLRNQRTMAAFEHGVKARAIGDLMCYRFSPADYMEAERAGYDQADERISRGELWMCGNCGAKHGS